ncbi:hypothetical protein BMW22_08615 [Rhizobium leguminosarum]|uniref:Uncharacterized protein n=1 Tax=Rhizobium leguminosarum TaxID=384 RepID=A0A1L3Z7N6_RHILE|nr:hypothetical protein BMW22_08615 [Rhizobium leguminosarum]
MYGNSEHDREKCERIWHHALTLNLEQDSDFRSTRLKIILFQRNDTLLGKINPQAISATGGMELPDADRRLGEPSNRVNDMDYELAFAATVATASFLVFMLIVHRT